MTAHFHMNVFSFIEQKCSMCLHALNLYFIHWRITNHNFPSNFCPSIPLGRMLNFQLYTKVYLQNQWCALLFSENVHWKEYNTRIRAKNVFQNINRFQNLDLVQLNIFFSVQRFMDEKQTSWLKYVLQFENC